VLTFKDSNTCRSISRCVFHIFIVISRFLNRLFVELSISKNLPVAGSIFKVGGPIPVSAGLSRFMVLLILHRTAFICFMAQNVTVGTKQSVDSVFMTSLRSI
jgi:hypothetical protein